MKTFIANFGRANYLWPVCKDSRTIAMLENENLRPIWESGNREAYIAYAIKHIKSPSGIATIKPVASRWFNLPTIFAETADDVWIHREKDELWWTVSKSDPVTTTLEPSNEPSQTGMRVYVTYKPTQNWSNADKRGRRLAWKALHPRAREFLFTEGTLQQLSEENAVYAQALINGEDLQPWHSQTVWKAKAERSGKGLVEVYDAARSAAYRMAMTAMATAKNSYGQEAMRTIKNKEVHFSSQDGLQTYLEALLVAQENLCAITSLPLQFDKDRTDDEMLCSLDRIDSDGHYEAGNLQVVCRFVNRWKSDGSDAEFRRLVRMLQTSAIPV